MTTSRASRSPWSWRGILLALRAVIPIASFSSPVPSVRLHGFREMRIIGNIRHGFVLTCVGDAGNITYKRSRRGDAEIDRAFVHILKQSGEPHRVIEFSPYGYDERQYCSPGFNLPVGAMMRSPHGEFPQYHTSADNLDFVRPEALADSLSKCRDVIDVLEHNRFYLNLKPKCEPQSVGAVSTDGWRSHAYKGL